MRVSIFDDHGNELGQAYVTDMKLDNRTRRVDIGATVMPMWRTLPEGGGDSAKSVMDTLMDHLVGSGNSSVSYSSRQPIVSIRSVGMS